MIKRTFNFCRALDALSGGRKVRRKAWDTQPTLLTIQSWIVLTFTMVSFGVTGP